jgi:nitrite reductase/ring-hydroxylating ferredoxin subunit
MTETALCAVDRLSDPGSLGIDGEEAGDHGFFLVRRGEKVYAYRNNCPHTGAPLEWQKHRFLDLTGQMIQCAMHGALFDIETGKCLRGPCVGTSLTSVKIRIESGQIYLAESS